MFVSSKLFSEATKTSTMHTLVLRYGPRHVLVLLPKTFQELLTTTRAAFDIASSSTLVFETSDLNICQDVAVEIHPAAWEAIAFTVSTVVVKDKDLVSPRAGDDDRIPTHPYTRGKSSLTPRRALTQATSYDDIQDSLPTDDVAEEEPGSYDDDFDVALAPRKGKSKSRARIGSDDEPEDGDEEGYIEAPPVAKLPASYRLRNAGEPSFSIVPSPSKRVTTPSRTSRRLGSFSPVRVRSGLVKSFPPPALNDEEQGEATYKLTQVASDESPRPGVTTHNQKEAENDDPTTPPKFKPQVKLEVSPALVPAPAPPGDKLLITIRHPPTEKENKFKVKATHTVGRVLTSACIAFGLNASGASLMLWTEEDGIEMSYRCENELSMGSVAADGALFVIELAK
ncbi:hypothetical protein BC826DRAFT_1036238 [Russula brevipes]|nr:hypothetical protein BC826DRAFT_1036238 [Russula brevipes]